MQIEQRWTENKQHISDQHGIMAREKFFEVKLAREKFVNGKEIVLVSCVKSKRDYPCHAVDMYTSPLFRKMISYAQSLNPTRIFILSAKYGLLNPEDQIAPYERTLKRMKSGERQVWAKSVLAALGRHCDLNADRFIFLAGLPYRESLVPHIRHYSVPMEGLSFGMQLQWLDRRLK